MNLVKFTIMAPTPINFAEQAWIHAAHYNNAMDNYQAFLAKNRSGMIFLRFQKFFIFL